MGDPSGIGPDIILAAWADRAARTVPDFYVIGCKNVFSERALGLGIDVSFSGNTEDSGSTDALVIRELDKPCNGAAGVPHPSDAAVTIEAIERAVDDVSEGKASALVTCPINKAVLYEAGFSFPGHTEFLGHLAEKRHGNTYQPVMMLAGPQLRTIPVTVHIPLSNVFGELTPELIVSTARIAERDLRTRFGISNPRLAVAGLNPHAGEAGALGREEIDIIIPAVEQLRQEGLNVEGPLPADTMFHAPARATFDVALCMYHDQALIPAKTIGFDDAANVTLGLPFIRTSPDHGTAYAIAGSGKANPASFVSALNMAAEMARHNVG